jgi:hypothetical protein
VRWLLVLASSAIRYMGVKNASWKISRGAT